MQAPPSDARTQVKYRTLLDLTCERRIPTQELHQRLRPARVAIGLLAEGPGDRFHFLAVRPRRGGRVGKQSLCYA